eukprot:SAG11_NODE_2673_length_3109_cov_1.528904_5_plen_54_part_00
MRGFLKSRAIRKTELQLATLARSTAQLLHAHQLSIELRKIILFAMWSATGAGC